MNYKSVTLIMAMYAEALPIIEGLSMQQSGALQSNLPMQLYSAQLDSMALNLIVSGKCNRYGVDCIGTEVATLSTNLAINHLAPDLIINPGTAGGFSEHGTTIGDVFLSHPMVCYHDRRIAIPGFDEYGLGKIPCADFSSLANKLGFKLGVVSTGSSLDFTDRDIEVMRSYHGQVKEMEAAAIGWVAHLHRVPFLAVKVITDIVDSPRPTEEEFLANLNMASEILSNKTFSIIHEINKR